jgi:organic hydroperoxide reductase OsmC/OhrA
MTPEPGVHRYAVSSSWSGSTGVGYDSYSRAHTTVAPPADGELRTSADPAFRGDAALVNPEQLLLAAATSCQLLSFLAVAARARVDVVDYRDDSEAEMPEADRPVRVTRITLRPRITVRGDVTDARLHHLVEVAHRECYIANSVSCEIVVEATFLRVAPAG